MKKRMPSPARRRPAPKRRRAAPFLPPEPEIVTGKFKGQKLSELSDQELTSFLRWDAQSQTRAVVPNIIAPSQPICQDISQYWFAKYELLERRKAPAERESSSPVKLTADDTNESIARKFLQYGYRAAARKHHSDVGGDDGSMRRLTEARDYALARLKK
ncbi:MAG: hypothetical protein ABSG41_05030 [Bryobacteraceae bacterium]|jgi:hypothetical protein